MTITSRRAQFGRPLATERVRTLSRTFQAAAAATALAAVLALTTQPAGAESFIETLTQAYGNNPAARAESARQRADDESVPQAISGWLPKAMLNPETGETCLRKRQSHNTNHHQAQARCYESKASLAQAKADVAISRYGLLSAAGHLSAYHLDLSIKNYDPTVKLKRIKFRPFSGVLGDPERRQHPVSDYEYETIEAHALPPAQSWAKPGPMPITSLPAKTSAWTSGPAAVLAEVPLPYKSPLTGTFVAPVVAEKSEHGWTGAVSAPPPPRREFGFDWNAD